MMDLVAQAEIREEEARHCFVSADKDGSGVIETSELKEVLLSLGLKQEGETDESFDALVGRCMKEHDANSDGVLSFNEFQRLYNAVKGVKLEDMRGVSTCPPRASRAHSALLGPGACTAVNMARDALSHALT